MIHLSTIAQRMADEINKQDWSDAHSRADGARHDRNKDRNSDASPTLSPEETDTLRMNVIWVVGQALAEDDPNFNIRDFATAAGASDDFLVKKNGKPSGAIEAGLRRTRFNHLSET